MRRVLAGDICTSRVIGFRALKEAYGLVKDLLCGWCFSYSTLIVNVGHAYEDTLVSS